MTLGVIVTPVHFKNQHCSALGHSGVLHSQERKLTMPVSFPGKNWKLFVCFLFSSLS